MIESKDAIAAKKEYAQVKAGKAVAEKNIRVIRYWMAVIRVLDEKMKVMGG